MHSKAWHPDNAGTTHSTLMVTDSHQLSTALTHTEMTTETRLMVDMASVREEYHLHSIESLAEICSADNCADCMTKLVPNVSLVKFMRTHKVSHGILQYVIERKYLRKC